jgi:hypothetical protein
LKHALVILTLLIGCLSTLQAQQAPQQPPHTNPHVTAKPVVVAPAPPSMPAATAAAHLGAGTHSVALTWGQGTCSSCVITGNKVYKGTTSGGPYTVINTATSPITSYTDSGIAGGVTAYYVVTAVCSSCNPTESGYSNQVTTVTPSDAPQPPSGLSAVAQ